MTGSAETFAAEYPCDWACRIELDLTGLHDRFNRGQMRRAVDDCHKAVHAGGTVRDQFTVTNMQKAGAR
jgi:hypothetical protein